MHKYLVKLVSFVAILGLSITIIPAGAAGVTTSYEASGPLDGEIDIADVVDNYATTSVSWISSEFYTTNTIIYITVDWSDTPYDAASNSGMVSTTDGIQPCSLSGYPYLFGQEYNFQNSDSNELDIYTAELQILGTAVTTTGHICVRVPVVHKDKDNPDPTTANFSLAIMTSNVNSDYGAIEYYVNGGNDVFVDASVQATLEFAIVSSTAVSVEKHVCHMGTLEIATVGECDYALRISTNAGNGFQVSMNAEHEFGTGNATITDIIESVAHDEAVSAGEEEYGMMVEGATIGGRNATFDTFSEPLNEVGPFDDDDTPVTTATSPIFVSYDDAFWGTSTLSTSKITHRAGIDATTPVGYYFQEVKYYISPNF